MKRLVAISLSFLMVFGLCACGEKTENSNNSNAEVEQSDANKDVEQDAIADTKDDTTSSNPEEEKDLEGVAYVSARSIAVNYDESRRKDTKSNSIVFHSQTSNIIALTYDKQNAFSGSVDDVFALLNDGDLFKDISTYAGASFKGNDNIFSINMKSSENKTVSGKEAVCISGNVVDADGKECEVYAYTFVIDDTPCMLIGLSFDSSVGIESVKTEIDQMALTIREE